MCACDREAAWRVEKHGGLETKSKEPAPSSLDRKYGGVNVEHGLRGSWWEEEQKIKGRAEARRVDNKEDKDGVHGYLALARTKSVVRRQ